MSLVLPSILVKTESQQNKPPRHFMVRDLSDFVGELEDELVLCPVRALEIYLERTKNLVGRPLNLFVSQSRITRAASKNAISSFIRSVIQGVYGKEDNRGDIKAHSVRAMGTSLAFSKNCSVKQVMEAATWKSNTVFTSLYLKDVQYIYENIRTLGPIVAAGQVI